MISSGCGSYRKDTYDCDEYEATQYIIDMGRDDCMSNNGGYAICC